MRVITEVNNKGVVARLSRVPMYLLHWLRKGLCPIERE